MKTSLAPGETYVDLELYAYSAYPGRDGGFVTGTNLYADLQPGTYALEYQVVRQDGTLGPWVRMPQFEITEPIKQQIDLSPYGPGFRVIKLA